MASARSGIDNTINDASARVREVGSDVQGKYDSYKDAAKGKLEGARDSTENLYKEARATADRKTAEVRADAQKKGEEAKQGWLSWLGWGKSKAEEGKKETAGKVADTAEDVRSRAEKHI